MEQFIQDYLQRGWGSMNKNDFEVWIFYQLLQGKVSGCDLKNKTDYQIAITLRISESRVKRLRYEATIKYGIPTGNATKEFNKMIREKVLMRVQYKKEGEKVQFVVQDKLLRQHISDVLSQDGRFFDSSFNSNIVSIHIDDFIFLISKLYTQEEQNELIDIVKDSSDAVVTDFPKDNFDLFTDCAKSFITGVLKDTIGEFTVDAMIKDKDAILENIKGKRKITTKQSN